MAWLSLAFAFLTGILNTVQSGSNTTLNKTTGTPFWCVVVVFGVALGTASVTALVSGQRLPSLAEVHAVPWWAWIGGVFGASYILCMMLTAEKLGAAVFMGATVTAAVITSLVMDHFGLLGFDRHPAGFARLAGGALMLAGLTLIAIF